MKYEVIQARRWGAPKLKRPEELKGRKKTFSVGDRHLRLDWYLLPGGVAIVYCNNFFSKSYSPPPEFGPCHSMNEIIAAFNKQFPSLAINPKKEKFVYPDNYGEIILRNEAWLKFSEIPENFKFFEMAWELPELFFKAHGPYCNDPINWRRLLVDAVEQLKYRTPDYIHLHGEKK